MYIYVYIYIYIYIPASQRGGKKIQVFHNIRPKYGSNKGHNLALTVLCVPLNLIGAIQQKQESGVAEMMPQWSCPPSPPCLSFPLSLSDGRLRR